MKAYSFPHRILFVSLAIGSFCLFFWWDDIKFFQKHEKFDNLLASESINISFDEYADCVQTTRFRVSLPSLRLLTFKNAYKECKIFRFDENKKVAEKILSGKHLVFIGDSLTRYQYLSLVHFLENGSFISSFPDMMWEKEYTDWNQFFAITNGRLNGHEKCDCYRNSNSTGVGDAFENRFYHNPDTEVKISYFQWLGPHAMRFHDNFFQYAANEVTLDPAETTCIPGTCSKAIVAFQGVNAVQFSQQWLEKLNPYFLVINCGLWKACGSDEDITALAQSSAEALEKSGSNRRNVIWKATTATIDGRKYISHSSLFLAQGARVMPADLITGAYLPYLKEEMDEIARAAEQRRALNQAKHGSMKHAKMKSRTSTNHPIVRNISDHRESELSISDVYRDKKHLTAPIYAELNNFLLNMLAI